MPLGVLVPRVGREEGVLLVGAGLHVTPVTLEHVLPALDELPGAREGAFVHGVRGHAVILAQRWARLDSNSPANRLFSLAEGAPVGARCEHASIRPRVAILMGHPSLSGRCFASAEAG